MVLLGGLKSLHLFHPELLCCLLLDFRVEHWFELFNLDIFKWHLTCLSGLDCDSLSELDELCFFCLNPVTSSSFDLRVDPELFLEVKRFNASLEFFESDDKHFNFDEDASSLSSDELGSVIVWQLILAVGNKL